MVSKLQLVFDSPLQTLLLALLEEGPIFFGAEEEVSCNQIETFNLKAQ